MRAAVVRSFGGPEAIELLTTARPSIKSDEVLVRNHAAGVNPVDTYIRAGQYAKLPPLPYSPGKDGAGVVEQIGDNVKHVKIGDRVWYGSELNSSAQFTAVKNAFPLPDGVSFSEGASLGVPYLTAYRALFHLAGAKAGDVILVHGASGGVGSALMQLAAWKNIEAVGTAGSEQGIEFVRSLGAKKVYDHTKTGYVDEIKHDYATGFNYIFEMSAHLNLNTDMGLLAPRGKIAVIGNRAETVINARQLMATEGSVFGVALGLSTNSQLIEFGNSIVSFLRETTFRPIVNKEYPLEDVGRAHKDIMSSKARGNLVIRID
uniref:PKS_ER domain-containing protein n=1 Tax=Caenorhabditis japonica TaxID=281687 RepID=A0A8R1DGJ8_CAEJA